MIMSMRNIAAASLALAVVVAATAMPARAQTPPAGYVPPDPTLFSTTVGFRLAWPPVTGASRYAIRLGLTNDDGIFIADDELANIDASQRTYDIDAVLPHTEPNRCYTARWRIYALIGTSAAEPPGEHSVRMCTDADNRSSFVNVAAAASIPAVGTGPSPAAHPHAARAIAYALALAGAALIDIAVLRLRRQR